MLQLRPIAERLSLLTIFLVDDGAHGCCGVGGFFGAGDVHPAEAQGAGFAREREVGSAAAGVVSDVGGGVVRFACWCVGGAIDAARSPSLAAKLNSGETLYRAAESALRTAG